jgi:hypothetical protein
MEGLTSYLREVSMLDYLANDGWVIVAGCGLILINICFTLIHTNQERSGRLWDYFGRVEGVKISNAVGILLFFILLTLALWFLGISAIPGHWLLFDGFLGTELALAGIGMIIGTRISDSLYSHLWLDKKYKKYAKNPGLRSVPLYLVEAALLAVVFAPGFVSSIASAGAAGIGFVAGWAAFALIRPIIRLFRYFERLRQERWIPVTG